MAAVLAQDLVTFTDTSVENISHAKEFWRAIDGYFDKKSRLFVTGADHRLRTASGNKRKATTGKSIQSTDKESAGLISNRNEATKRLEIEEEEYVNTVLDKKKQQQDLLKKRTDERLAKEKVRKGIKETLEDELSSFEPDDDKYNVEDEGRQAMNDIDNFERMVKISNERRKERHDNI